MPAQSSHGLYLLLPGANTITDILPPIPTYPVFWKFWGLPLLFACLIWDKVFLTSSDWLGTHGNLPASAATAQFLTFLSHLANLRPLTFEDDQALYPRLKISSRDSVHVPVSVWVREYWYSSCLFNLSSGCFLPPQARDKCPLRISNKCPLRISHKPLSQATAILLKWDSNFPSPLQRKSGAPILRRWLPTFIQVQSVATGFNSISLLFKLKNLLTLHENFSKANDCQVTRWWAVVFWLPLKIHRNKGQRQVTVRGREDRTVWWEDSFCFARWEKFWTWLHRIPLHYTLKYTLKQG